MKNIIFENFRGKHFSEKKSMTNFFSPNAPKTSKTRKSRFLEHMKNIIFENFRGKIFPDFFSDDHKYFFTKCSKNLKNTKNTIFEISKVLKFWIEIFEFFDLLSSLSSKKKIHSHTIFLKLFYLFRSL